MLRGLRWIALALAALVLLLVCAAGALWWWAGQEGSLEWTLRRVARDQPVQVDGVTGSLRGGWRIGRLAWERDGLRVEAENVALEWQPLALLSRTVRLDQVHASAVRVTDGRPAGPQPFQLPDSLGLPWRVTVDEFAVDRLVVRGTVAVDASGLAGRYAFDGLTHRAALRSLQLAGGRYSGDATLLALAPQTLDVRLRGQVETAVPGSTASLPLAFDARARGPLRGFEVTGELRVRDASRNDASLPHATVTARITPFDAMPVPRAQADFRQIDLAAFWPQAPKSLLGGQLSVAPVGTSTWQLSADVRNAQAGRWDQGRVPVDAAKVQAQWRDGIVVVQALRIDGAGGHVEGRGGWEDRDGHSGWTFDGRVDAVDPARVHGDLSAWPVSGPVHLAGQGRVVDFDVALTATPGKAGNAGLALREALAKGRWAGDLLSVPRLRLRTSDALLEGSLEAHLDSRSGSGDLQLRAPGLQASAKGQMAASRGDGKAQLQVADIDAALRWLRRWPGLHELAVGAPALHGKAEARLAWQGGWSDPTVQGDVQLATLVVGEADKAADAPPPWSVRAARLQVEGRLRDARVDLRVQAERGQRKVDLTAAGRVGRDAATGATWRGQVASLELQAREPAVSEAPWRVQLQRAVDWRWVGGNFELAAGEATLRAPKLRGGAPATDAQLTWGPVRRQGGVLTTSGRLAGLPMAWIELVGGAQLAGAALSGDMVFDAQWNAQLGDSLRLDASVARVRGDVNVLAETLDGSSARLAAGVKEAKLTLSNQGEQLSLALVWDSERAGQAQGQLRTQLARTADGGWTWPAQAPLAGTVRASLPRIGVWSLLAPPGWRLRGSLAADITIAGTRAVPDLNGTVRADDLALRSVVDGIELRNGRLRAELAGQRVVVSEFLLRGSDEGGGGGTLAAQGEGAWTAQGLQLQVNAQLTQLRASIRADRQLTVSGPLAARVDRTGTQVTGDLTIDRARIQIPDETPPRLGDDVLVRNATGLSTTEAERRLRPAPSEAGRTVTLKVSMDLGKDFRLSGRGVDTGLAGKVEIEGRSLSLPRITGTIQAVGGTYNGYGQRMTIEKGDVRFTGPPDNPSLDVLAIRPNIDQRVGVQITGRAQSPVVRLYSEAGLSEAETLSWLVLGRSSAGGGAEAALLQRAAAALLAGRRGGGKGVAGTLGLDDFSVRSDGTAGTVVRVGKRFADNFYAAFERSLSGAVGTLYIFYDLSKRVTLRAEAGERAGLDLIYTFTIDSKPGASGR